MGRKSVFENEEIKKLFFSALKMGFSNEKACDYAGISEVTLYATINKGEKDLSQNKKNTVYANFVKEYKKAKAAFIMRHTAKIEKASEDGSWQASAWLLERRCASDYGRQVKISDDNNGILGKLLEALQENNDDEQ